MNIDNRKLIRSSVDIRYYRFNLLLWVGLMAAIVVISLILGAVLHDSTARYLGGIFLVFTMPELLWITYKYIRISIKPSNYERFTGEVTNVNYNIFTKNYNFSLLLTDKDGTQVSAQTNTVFTSTPWTSFYFGSYSASKLDVLYDWETGRTVVAGTALGPDRLKDSETIVDRRYTGYE